jgi:hypothetical protein
MDAAKSLIPSELIDFLLNIAPIRPVFIWGPSDIGKFSLAEACAYSVGLPAECLLPGGAESILLLDLRSPYWSIAGGGDRSLKGWKGSTI